MTHAKTYFIDPVAGDDAATGTQPAQAWRSFEPINRLTLAAGDRVRVAPGAFAQGLLITGQGTADAPIVVRFAPGRYDIHTGGGPTRRYHISNCNEVPHDDKTVALLIERAQHVRVEGPGARIVCRGKMIEACVDHSEAVTIEGLSFDYHRPTVSEMTVVVTTDDYADVEVHADSTYRVEGGGLTWFGEGWEHDHGLAQELVPETGRVWRRANLLKGLTVEELSPGRLRIGGDHRMALGRVFQVRDPFRDCCGVLLNRSRGVTLRGVNLCFMHGMGVLCQFTQDITLDRVAIAPDPDSGRTTSAWADCLHLSGCRGRVTVTGVTFRGAHDDAINIHGTYLRIADRPSENQIKVRFMHRQTYGFAAFDPGDEVALVHSDTLERYQHNRVTGAELLDEREMLLTLAEPVSAEWRDRDALENMTWTPQAEVRDCHVSVIPTRGFLISTPRRAVIAGNTFVRTHMAGIEMNCDARDWFESGPVGDVEITGNRFEQCRHGGIRIQPSTDRPTPGVSRNVRIRGNTFELYEGPAVFAQSCAKLSITGNDVNAGDEPRVFQVDESCVDAIVADNHVERDGGSA